MARPHRIEFPGAFYHVIVRGNQRQNTFIDDEDRRVFLARVRRYKEKEGFILYAYVLMPNHVHFLVETADVPLSKIMQRINLTYTQYFNRKYNQVGHIFQGRYKSLLCDRDEYFLALIRYIHLNPVRAKLVNSPRDYKWSSHNIYLSGRKDFVDTEKVLRVFSKNMANARRRYAHFVQDGLNEGRDESLYRALGQQILGDDDFVEEVDRRLAGKDKPLRKPSLKEILKAIQESTGVTQKEILSRGRKEQVKLARGVLVGVWREFGYRLVDLQKELRRDLSVLSRLSRIAESGEGQNITEKVCRRLNAHMQA
jgi:REP-associated tyrosine transposase